MRRRIVLFAIVFASSVANVQAQVPPHAPGAICFTQFFWCWAQPPGPPGSGCSCPSPYGWQPGVRG